MQSPPPPSPSRAAPRRLHASFGIAGAAAAAYYYWRQQALIEAQLGAAVERYGRHGEKVQGQ